jgi:hypothetical protein
MRRGGGGGMRRLALLLVGGVALALAAAQVLLPRIAASRISSRVGRYGGVQEVEVRAWPAVELLWGHADSVSVRAKPLSLSPAQAAKLLWEARGVQRMELAAPEVRVGPLRLTGARLHKRGSSLTAEAGVSEADMRAALPPGLEVQLLGSEGGRVRVRAGGGLFGVGASVQAIAEPSEGRLIAHPLGVPLQGLRLTLFSDPHVYVEGVGAERRAGQAPGYRVSMSARLR